MTNSPRIVDKPWGSEEIWAHTPRYVGKLIHIEAGKRLSLQYHERKVETIRVMRGRLRLHYGEDRDQVESRILEPGESAHVPAGMIHRFEALVDTDLIEVSSPELDDVVRVEDDFGREGTSAP